jgi:YVTN family beta-propeller protein
MNIYRTKPVLRALSVVFVSLIIFSCNFDKPRFDQELYNKLQAKKVLLPNGWSLTSPSNSFKLDELPMNLQVSSSGRFAAVTNNGYGRQSVMLFDVKGEKLLDSVEIPKAWYGLKFSDDEKALYVSGGNDNMIRIYDIMDKHLVAADSIVLGSPWPNKIGPAGIELDEDTNKLFTVTKEDSALYVVNLKTNVSRKYKLPAEGFACTRVDDRLYISVWGAEKIAVFDIKDEKITGFIEVESHPNEMIVSKDKKYLFVANANSNSVSVINLDESRVVETIGTALFPDAPAGSTPNGLAISEDGKKLYISNADNNCLAVFDISESGESKALGFIPTGWYPISVKAIGGNIWVTNGKGERSMPNAKGPNPYLGLNDSVVYSGRMFKGTLSIIPEPDEAEMNTYTRVVYENTPYSKMVEKNPEGEKGNPIPLHSGEVSPIKHVFYIIKENRTYDQVLGDIAKGNGDPDLCLFGKEVSPNHHQLIETFALFDNFYVNAEVSADGHNWSMGAYATDYTEKTWPTYYGGRGGNYDWEGTRKIAFPEDGYIWDYCKKTGISYRSYGEFIDGNGARVEALEGHYAKSFTSFNLGVMDTVRYNQWKEDFDSLLAIGVVPQFNIIRLPNDHTVGARSGDYTPRAMVADNDLALGRMIEHISHSKIWEESAIFILEDDAQNGPDHVDAHRSVLMVVSPYTKRNYVDHTLYSTASVLRTMELILGLPPMSQYDAAAVPLYRSFTEQIDLTPYSCLPNSYPLDERNPVKGKLARVSEKFNFDKEDAADDIALNEVIWKTVRGENSKMPPPRRGAFIRVLANDDDDD